MGVFDIVSGLAKAAGQGYEGYGVDQQTKVRNALAQQNAARDAERDKVLNALTKVQTTKLAAPPAPEYKIENGQRIDVGAGKATPIEGFTPEAPKDEYRIENGQRINLRTNQAEPIEGFKAPEAPKPNLSFQTVVPGEGQAPVIVGVDPKSGQKVSEVGVAKPSGSMAKLTEDQGKSYLYYNLMEKSQPQIDNAMKSGKVRKLAVSGFINTPGPMQAGVNALLNDEERSLIRAFRDFAAGVLRKESGAAVGNDELKEVWGRFGPGFGDDPKLDAEKSQARTDYMTTMRQMASPAIDFYSRGSSGQPVGDGAPPSRAQQLWDAAVKKHGEPKVLQDFGPRPPE
jgi:hypothetical protein